jgi:hypothetical protein
MHLTYRELGSGLKWHLMVDGRVRATFDDKDEADAALEAERWAKWEREAVTSHTGLVEVA